MFMYALCKRCCILFIYTGMYVSFCLYVLICTFLYFVYMYWYVRFCILFICTGMYVFVFCLYVLVCTFLYFVYMYWYVRFILFLIVHRVLVLSTCMYSHCIILCLVFMPSHFLFVYYIDDHLSINELYCFTQDSD